MIPTRITSLFVAMVVGLGVDGQVALGETIRYVNLNNSNPLPPYTTWATAATNIQDAIDVANGGDEILVTNGDYNSGSQIVSGMTNRVAATIPVAIVSANGPNWTTIDGGGAMRCITMADGCWLAGFTLTNGWTPENGGAARCDTTNVVISNCVVTASFADNEGGGVFQGNLVNCTLAGNSASGLNQNYAAGGGANSSILSQCAVHGNIANYYAEGGGLYNCAATHCVISANSDDSWGGGATESILDDCLILSNFATSYGGGVYGSTVINCTIVSNASWISGGGIYGCTAENSIIIGNGLVPSGYPVSPSETNYGASTLDYCCASPLATNGAGDIAGPPDFVNPLGDWHLRSNSPCISAGNNSFVVSATDLDGNPRIVGPTVDMGAYEYQLPTIVITVQPVNQARRVGGAVQFVVSAISPYPLGYQWLFNGAPLSDDGRVSGSLTAALTISNLTQSDGGAYSVQITNYEGGVISSNALLQVNGPEPGVPYITSFNPGSGAIGTQITIIGTNFSSTPASNVVWFGATRATVLTASPTNLVAGVPPGATYAPITVNVNGLTGAASGNFVPTFAGNGTAVSSNSFASPINLATGSGPLAMAVADMDGDGKPDLVVANIWDHTISIYRNTSTPGTISFAPRVDLPPMLLNEPEEGDPNFIAVGDLDGDGKPDILACDWAHNQILVYQNLATPGDLTTNSFAPGIGFGAEGEPINVRVADMDGDGRPEIIIANHVFNEISILRNLSTPGVIASNSFAPHVDYPTAGGTWDVAIADLDGDGKPDMAAANNSASLVSCFRNVGVEGVLDTNTFQPRVDLPAPPGGSRILAADLDGDGEPDLIVGATPVGIYQNISGIGALSTNSFSPMIVFSNISASALAIGDLNGDGKPDICLNFNLSILQNNCVAGTIATNSFGPLVTLPGSYRDLVVCDLDGDGRPDIAACNLDGNTICIYQNVTAFGGPPVIVAQPANMVTPINTMATVTVYASGQAPLNYQWYIDGTNASDSGRISGSMTTSLSISNIQPTDTDSCYVIVSNALGTATSLVATITPVILPPAIVQQPLSQTNILGSNGIFSATFTGSQPMTFQWFFNSNVLTDGGQITGSATTSLLISDLVTNDAGSYQIVASNGAGAVTSAVANLVVLVPPGFNEEPSNESVELGSNAVFSVGVVGTPPLGFQWYFNGSLLTNSARISGATSALLAISNVQEADVGSYTVTLTNAAGTATSSVATLSISTPLITAQPISETVYAGATVSMSANVSGSQPLFFQWQFDGTNLAGATTNPIVLSNVLVSQAGTYSVMVTNAYGEAASSNATLTVTALAISTQPSNCVTWLNGTASFRVAVSGNGPFSYQWQENGSPIPNVDTNVLGLTNVAASEFGTFNVMVSNAYGNVTSSNALLIFSQVAVWGGYQGESNLTTNLTNIIAISAGINGAPYDCLALNASGVTVAWPVEGYGMTPATNLISIAGAYPLFGLQANGQVIRWPSDGTGVISGISNVVAIAASGENFAILMSNGVAIGEPPPVGGPAFMLSNVTAITPSAYMLLNNGVPTNGSQIFPPGWTNIIAVGRGENFELALRGDGVVLGSGIGVPPGLSNVVAIAAGEQHCLALRANGTVVAWGNNSNGQTNVPPGLTNVIAIAAGADQSMALIGSGPPFTSAVAGGASVTHGVFSVALSTQSGHTYQLESEGSLPGTNWVPVTLQPGTSQTQLLVDPNATNAQRFYRVLRW